MIAMAAQKEPKKVLEINNWWRWGLGLVIAAVFTLLFDIGHYGSQMKKTQTADHQRIDDIHNDNEKFQENTNRRLDRIEDKIDRLIERGN